ncbi:rho GTPase-activating 25 [Pelobates cultripes]|uniref:Rho GTPase-activating 25 n=2 Tax=Pelobates cultripes TaxID=61616 RepID=A0AAD1RMR1_PELCU|nr:rho GTPase-activating 25 [Pelobates cultripes]CAH2274771.1 rho GTPase-activating 25 [Pelobates cultripes]
MSLKLPRDWDFILKPDLGKIARSVSMMSGDQTTLSNRIHNANPLEKPVKCGVLKKQQKSIVKSWQQKFFSLKGQMLFYFKDEADSKYQGCMYLPGSRVTEFSYSPDDAVKFTFEIIPGASMDQCKSEPYILMATSQAEMEDWVKAIRKAAGFVSGAVFGQRLVDTIAYEKKFGRHLIPILVEKCADFILEKGLGEEGVFRLPGQDNLVKQLKEAFDAGERPSFSRDTDVHTVASLFKMYLRELPEPVVPWCQFEDFLGSERMINIDEKKGHKQLMKQIKLLPKENYHLLSFICRFLYEVQKHSSINKMSVDNLAMVIGVNLMKPKTEDPVAIMQSTPQIQKLMTVMISYHEKFFPKTNDLPAEPAPQKNDCKKLQVPRSSVGWETSEETVSPGEDLPKTQMKDVSNSRGSSSSEDGITALEEGSLLKDKNGSWKAVPRKRTQTLPNAKFNTASKQLDSTANELKSEIFHGDFWMSPVSSNGHRACGFPSTGHKRTLSEDLKCQRKSTYDNVPCPQSDSGKSPISNPADLCENSCKAQQLQQQTMTYPKHCLKSPGAESKGCKNYAILPNLTEHHIEADLEKKQLEEQIKSLQEDNYEAWKKVVKLNEELEKEKNKRMALEIALQNVERSRDDAEIRNKLLEKEIQGFVKAMSASNNGP